MVNQPIITERDKELATELKRQLTGCEDYIETIALHLANSRREGALEMAKNIKRDIEQKIYDRRSE
jgi:sulfur transfer protein SufE